MFSPPPTIIPGTTSGNTHTVSAPRAAFTSVTKNGQTVAPANYTVGETDGKLTITFTDDYLASLGAGNHIFYINTSQGSSIATLTGTGSSTTTGTGRIYGYTTRAKVRLYALSGDEYKPVKLIYKNKGAKVRVIEQLEDGWWKVRVGGATYYIPEDDLELR